MDDLDNQSLGSLDSQESFDPNDPIRMKNKRFRDPPLPLIGTEVDIKKLVKRNHRMAAVFNEILRNVNIDSKDAATEARETPVADSTERVLVTQAVSERMHRTRTRKQNRLAREANINEIQRILAVRVRTHELMNENCSNVLVNKIEPIYIMESRSKVIY